VIERTTVVIVGSGFAGLCMAIKLREAGIDDYVILERAYASPGYTHDDAAEGVFARVGAKEQP
jgi:cation diffusion facilitator CzcD-associated flavoprotein CzcO